MAEIRGDRLAHLIEDRRTSQSKVAKQIGVSQPTIGRLISGETRETGKLLELAFALDTNPGYLVGTNDDPSRIESVSDRQQGFRGFPSQAQSSDTIELQEFDVSYGLGGSYIHEGSVSSRQRTFSRSWIRQFTASPFESLFWATGNGPSMMPAILDSDILLIDTEQKTPRMWDQFWALDMHGLGMIKALRPGRDGAMRILSINPDFPEETAYDGEMNVVGRVVAIVRKV